MEVLFLLLQNLGTSFSLFLVFALISSILFVLTWIGIKTSKKLLTRTFFVVTFLFLLPFIFITYTSVLGQPKLATLYWYQTKEDPEIISYLIDEQNEIYLWINYREWKRPVYISLEWSEELQKNLQSASTRAQANGTTVRMNLNSFMTQEDQSELFYIPNPTQRRPKIRMNGHIREFDPDEFQEQDDSSGQTLPPTPQIQTLPYPLDPFDYPN